jgi:hypothetical protein
VHILCAHNFAHHKVHCVHNVGGEVLRISGNHWPGPPLEVCLLCQEEVKQSPPFHFLFKAGVGRKFHGVDLNCIGSAFHVA